MEIVPPPRRNRGRPRGFDRDRALAYAMTLFHQRGYEGTSIADLVEAMGITPPSLYAAFGSKAHLYREVLDAYRAGPGAYAARALAEEPSAKAAIARLLREAARTFTADRDAFGCLISTAVLGCAPENDPVAEMAAAMRAEALEALAARLDRAVNDGEMPKDVDTRALTHFFGAIIQGMSVQARDGASEADLLALAETALAAWPQARSAA